MNLKKFTHNAVAGAAVASMLFASAAPAFAAATADIREGVPTDGVRLMFSDTDGDLADQWKDLDPREDNTRGGYYVVSEPLYLFGNGLYDESGDDSYDRLRLTPGGDIDAWGIIWENGNGSTVYNMYGSNHVSGGDDPLDLAADKTFFYTETEAVPGTTVTSVRNMIEDAAVDSTSQVEAVYYSTFDSNTPAGTWENYLEETVGAGNEQYGDPDLLAGDNYMTRMWVWFNQDDTNDDYVFEFPVMLADADQGLDTMDPSDVEVRSTNAHMRIDIKGGMPEGTLFWNVDIDGTGGDSFDTKYPVVFFNVTEDEEYDITVSSVNGEGSLSTGFEVNGVDAERLDFASDYPTDATHTHGANAGFMNKLALIDSTNLDDTITRGQITKTIVNLFGIPFNMYGPGFSDVSSTDTFGPYAWALQSADILRGTSSGEADLGSYLTRAQYASMIVRAARIYDEDAISGGSCSFADVLPVVHKDDICALADLNDEYIRNSIRGFSDGTFGGNFNITRGEAFTIGLFSAVQIPTTDGGSTAFINITGETRPFLPPVAISDLDVVAETESVVAVSWEDLQDSTRDASVDAYLVRIAEDGDSFEEDIDQTGGFATAAWLPTFSVATLDLDTLDDIADGNTITVGSCLVTFDSTGTLDTNCSDGTAVITENASDAAIATEVRTLTNVSDPNLGDLTVGGAGTAVTFTSEIFGGVGTNITIASVLVGDNTLTITTSAAVNNSTSMVDSIVLADGNDATDTVEFYYYGQSDDTDFDICVSAAKFVPIDYLDNEPTSVTQTAHEAYTNDFDEHDTNFIFGPEECINVDTKATE